MQTRPATYSKGVLFAGGILFGLYYTLCLYYFETYSLELFLKDGDRNGTNELLLYFPVAVILLVAAVAVVRMLFGELKPDRPRRPGWIRWAAIPAVYFISTFAALAIYGRLTIEQPEAIGGFLTRLLIFMLITGLLPLQAALMIIPQPKARRKKASGHQDPPKEKVAENDPARMLLIDSSQGEPQFKIATADLIAVEAADNYCKFHHLKDGQRKTKVLRMTMKEVEEALQGIPNFYRCHRSFLVSGAMVEEVLGNSQAYRLKMRYMDDPVPVSRAFDVEQLRPHGD